MDVVRWTPSDISRRSGGTIAEELLDVAAVVLDGFAPGDDWSQALCWVSSAPCPVIAVGDGPGQADIVCPEDRVEPLIAAATASPRAAAILVDVLRTVEHLDVASGLRVESLAYSTLLASSEFRQWLDARTPPSPKVFAGAPVVVERHADELVITLNRPENRNAFSAAMRDALYEALLSATLDPTLCQVVVSGRGPVFSAGGDLAEFGTATDVAIAHGIRTARSVGALLTSLPGRVHVHGACVGAGTELPAFAPVVVAHPDATFRLPEIAMGLIPGAGGTVSLTKRIGRHRTAELALSGRAMSAAEALEIGLVERIDER